MSTPPAEAQGPVAKVGWDRHDIVAAIYKKGSNLSALAEANGLKPKSLSTALNTAFPAADRVISSFIGVPLHELWPDRYDEKGNRKTLRRRRAA